MVYDSFQREQGGLFFEAFILIVDLPYNWGVAVAYDINKYSFLLS
jgi:hypothetical protein